MDERVARHLTHCVETAGVGSRAELGQLVERLYNEVRRISAAEMRRAFNVPVASLTLQPTALANDAIMRVLRQRQAVENSDQFFALATRFIRQLIEDYRRSRRAAKRGRGRRGVSLEHAAHLPEQPDDVAGNVLPILEQFHERHPRKAEVVTLHAICGQSLPKVARMLDISRATAERDWAFAKAWLADELLSEAGT
jgi:RNA polymerase sigma factor (TIGR02999 family)